VLKATILQNEGKDMRHQSKYYFAKEREREDLEP
jgi:hypothetical protein